jgi:hypothetical protein
MEVEQPLLAPVKDKRVVESGVNAADSADSDNFVTQQLFAQSRGQCYDQYFRRFLPIFCDKIGVCIEIQRYDHFLPKYVHM